MVLIVAGIVIFIATSVAFWMCLPDKDGKTHRLTDTEWEPYVAVAFCAGFSTSFTMILSGILNVYA